MATPQQKLPKGPSNSSGFGTPGTQQTAQKNVKTGGFDPNMPKAPQAARQARSSYQQSLGAQAGVPGAPASGYSLFSGMPTQQALGLNRSLGLSNLGPMGGGTPPPQDRGDLPGTTTPAEQAGWESASMPWLTGREVLAEQSGVPHKEVFPENALQGTPAEQAGWESASMPWLTDREVEPFNAPGAAAPPSDQELATGEATTTEDMVWGMYSNGTMSAEEAQAALGLSDIQFDRWAQSQGLAEEAGIPYEQWREEGGVFRGMPEPGTEEFDAARARTIEDEKADARARLRAGVGAPQGDASGLEAQAAFGAQFYEDPDKMMGLATNNVLRKDKPGYEDEKVQEVKNNLAKQAEIAYQQNLDQLMRQFAVMGTAGSGAFMMANNNLAVQIYGKLLDEYAQIDLKNLDQIEIDLQQEVQNLLAISQMGYDNKEDFYETLKNIDENLFMTFTGFLEAMNLTDEQNGQWFQAVAELYEAHWNKVVSGEMTEEEFTDIGMGILSGKIAEFNLTAEQAAGAWDAMDESYASQADPSSPKPDDAEPPPHAGTHVGHFREYDGHIWKWNEDTQLWEWQGKQK